MPGPSNLYGVANPVIAPTLVSAPADVVCNPAVWTTVISAGPFTAISGGVYLPYMSCGILVAVGATPPTGLNAGFSINNGSSVLNVAWDYRLFQANLEYALTFPLNGVPSSTAWQGLGSTVQLQVTPAGTAVTVRSLGTWIEFSLLRGPDQ